MLGREMEAWEHEGLSQLGWGLLDRENNERDTMTGHLGIMEKSVARETPRNPQG